MEDENKIQKIMKSMTLKRTIIVLSIILLTSSIAFSATQDRNVVIHEDVWLAPDNEDFEVSFSSQQEFNNITVTTEDIRIGGDYYDFADPTFGDEEAFDIDADNEVEVVLMDYIKNSYEDTNIKFNVSAVSGTSSSFYINNLLDDRDYVLWIDNSVYDYLHSNSTGGISFDYSSFSSHTILIEGDEAPEISNESPANNSVGIRADQDLSLSVDISNVQEQSTDVELYFKGNLENTKTISNNGTVQFYVDQSKLIEGENPSWTIKATDSNSNTNSKTYNLHLIDSPEPDNGSASPQGDEQVDTYETTLSIDVSDTDFSNTNDEVTVDFYVDGSKVESKTISSNQTVSYQTDPIVGGDHTWHAEIEDSYGLTTTSDTFNFKTPDKLYIRNIDDTSKLINSTNYDLGNASVKVRFYNNDLVITRDVEDGVANLTGLPNRNFVVSARIDGWTDRRIYIDDLSEQGSVYLLQEENETVLSTVFVKSDLTGNFPDENTVLKIEKPITLDGTTEWRTVSGDYFGAAGRYSALLKYNDRYRIKVENDETNNIRTLGTFKPQASREVKLEIGGISIEVPKDQGYKWELNRDRENHEVSFEYSDLANETTELNVTIYQEYNSSNVLSEVKVEETLGTYKFTEDLTGEQVNQTWVANVSIMRDGKLIEESSTVDAADGTVGLFDPLNDMWKKIFALGLLLFLAGVFSQVHSSTGAIVIALFGTVMWWMGWLSVGLGFVVLANVLAVANKLNNNQT